MKIPLTRDELNIAVMRIERKLRVAWAQQNITSFYPEQLADDTIDVQNVLFVMRKLEEDGKIKITLTATDNGVVTFRGKVVDFVTRGEPNLTTMITIDGELTPEWIEEF